MPRPVRWTAAATLAWWRRRTTDTSHCHLATWAGSPLASMSSWSAELRAAGGSDPAVTGPEGTASGPEPWQRWREAAMEAQHSTTELSLQPLKKYWI